VHLYVGADKSDIIEYTTSAWSMKKHFHLNFIQFLKRERKRGGGRERGDRERERKRGMRVTRHMFLDNRSFRTSVTANRECSLKNLR